MLFNNDIRQNFTLEEVNRLSNNRALSTRLNPDTFRVRVDGQIRFEYSTTSISTPKLFSWLRERRALGNPEILIGFREKESKASLILVHSC